MSLTKALEEASYGLEVNIKLRCVDLIELQCLGEKAEDQVR